MEKKTISIGLKKATEFIAQLTALHFDLLGYPTIKMHADYVEVYFDTAQTIRNLGLINLPADEFRMFNNDTNLTIVYTFNNGED